MLKLFKFLSIAVLMILFTLNFSMASTVSLYDDNIISGRSENIKVPILLYHNLMDNYDPQLSSVHISPTEFKEHMNVLKKAGYSTITFQNYYNYVVNNEDLPEKPIIITFDDGYSSNYEHAYPILKNLNMKATIFVVTGRMGADEGIVYPHFNWEQAREMQESGIIDIQSHSDLHPNMTEIDKGLAQLELRLSKYLIEKELQKTCNVFAYPYGLYNDEFQDMAEKAGYDIQVAVGDRGVNVKSNGLKQLKRLTVFGGTNGEELLQMIENNIKDGQTQ